MKQICLSVFLFFLSIGVNAQIRDYSKSVLTENGIQIDTFEIKNLKVTEQDNKWLSIDFSYKITGVNKDKAIHWLMSYELQHILNENIEITPDSCLIVNMLPFMQLTGSKGLRDEKKWQPFQFQRYAKQLLYLKDVQEAKIGKILFCCEDKTVLLEMPEIQK